MTPHPKQGCLAEFTNAPSITCPSGPSSGAPLFFRGRVGPDSEGLGWGWGSLFVLSHSWEGQSPRRAACRCL